MVVVRASSMELFNTCLKNRQPTLWRAYRELVPYKERRQILMSRVVDVPVYVMDKSKVECKCLDSCICEVIGVKQ